MNREQLRQQARAARAALSHERRQQATAALCTAVFARLSAKSMRIGGYLPIGGEINLRPALRAAVDRGHLVFLPRVVRRSSGQMQFLQWSGDADDLDPDACGIPAPPSGSWMCAAERLDLVLVPGCAFDDHGNRLGSGAGFYDRAFQFRHHAPAPPLLLGIACAEQRCPPLAAEPWDIRMDEVLFDR